MKILRRLAPLAAAAALLSGSACGAFGPGATPASSRPAPVSGPGAASPSTTFRAASASAASGASGASTARRSHTVRKLMVVVVENHSLGEMRTQMPYVRSLADRYGYATRYTAQTHPSLPNYLAMVGGSTFGVHDDAPPSAHPLPGRSVFGEAVNAGRTVRVYADAMSKPCQTTAAGTYGVKHNAWAYFRAERSLCRQHDVPVRALARDARRGRLPAIGMIVPDLCHDAHDCPLGRADDWLRAHLRPLTSGPDWRAGRLAIVITADEDDDHHGNRILTVVADPALHGRVVSSRLDHYSLARSYANVAGVRPLRHARTARPLLQAFGLTVR